jgi:RNA polymerase sigma-70 factor (ECF subfamily)
MDLPPEHPVRYGEEESIELAFVAALQCLPPRSRAVLVLSDVLGFGTGEVAEILDAREAWVDGALAAARETVGRLGAGPGRERIPAAGSAEERELVDRFTDAFVSGDAGAVAAVLSREAWAAIARFFSTVHADRFRLVHTRANSQPALACYLADLRAPLWRAHGLMVLTLEDDRISSVRGFPDASLFGHFGLPRTLHG